MPAVIFLYILRDMLTKYQLVESSGLYYKTFRIIIYDCNDSTITDPVL
jgi:hypothetical protein